MATDQPLDLRTDLRLAFKVPEVAGLLGVSRRSAYRAAEAGELPTIKVGGTRLVLRADLLAFLKTPDPALPPTMAPVSGPGDA